MATDDYTRRRLRLTETCGEGFVRINVDGTRDVCCFTNCEFRDKMNRIHRRFVSSWNNDKVFPRLPGSFPGIRFSTWNEHDIRTLGEDYYKLFAFHYQSERFE